MIKRSIESNNIKLSRIFSSSLVDNLIRSQDNLEMVSFIKSLGISSIKKTNTQDAISHVYEYLKKFYRCEYVYKNEIANQVLLKQHSLRDTVLLRELYSGSSIADLVMVNGETSVYEIKSDLDSFSRLKGQLKSYSELYDKINVVTNQVSVSKLINTLPKNIGIIYMNDHGDLETVQESISNVDIFNPSIAIYSLRQSELTTSYENYIAPLQEMGSGLKYKIVSEWFLSLPRHDSRNIFRECLKMRRLPVYQIELISKIDRCLVMLMLSKQLSKVKCSSLISSLTK